MQSAHSKSQPLVVQAELQFLVFYVALALVVWVILIVLKGVFHSSGARVKRRYSRAYARV